MERRAQIADVYSAIYRGVWYSLVRETSADLWRYKMKIGELTKEGRIDACLALLAVRRVKLRIDRELKKPPLPEG